MSLAEYIKSLPKTWIEVSPINIPENYNTHEDFKDFDISSDTLFTLTYYITHKKTFYILYNKNLNLFFIKRYKPLSTIYIAKYEGINKYKIGNIL